MNESDPIEFIKTKRITFYKIGGSEFLGLEAVMNLEYITDYYGTDINTFGRKVHELFNNFQNFRTAIEHVHNGFLAIDYLSGRTNNSNENLIEIVFNHGVDVENLKDLGDISKEWSDIIKTIFELTRVPVVDPKM